MTRRLRTEVLIRGERSLSKELARTVGERHEVRTVQVPDEGMVMLTLRESARNSLFHPGEVFITEARVSVDGYLGLGLVKGFDAELAMDLAVVDAAFNAQLPVVNEWETALQEGLVALRMQDHRDFQDVLATKVNFESMDQEAPQ